MKKVKCKKHQWKKDIKKPSVILLDTFEKESATYYTFQCSLCKDVDERIDKRTRKKIKEKFLLKAKQRYLIGNRGNFAPYLVEEDSLFIIK